MSLKTEKVTEFFAVVQKLTAVQKLKEKNTVLEFRIFSQAGEEWKSGQRIDGWTLEWTSLCSAKLSDMKLRRKIRRTFNQFFALLLKEKLNCSVDLNFQEIKDIRTFLEWRHFRVTLEVYDYYQVTAEAVEKLLEKKRPFRKEKKETNFSL